MRTIWGMIVQNSQQFSNSNEYIMWHDEYTFEEYYNRSDKTKMTDGAKARYEEWKRKNGKE